MAVAKVHATSACTDVLAQIPIDLNDYTLELALRNAAREAVSASLADPAWVPLRDQVQTALAAYLQTGADGDQTAAVDEFVTAFMQIDRLCNA